MEFKDTRSVERGYVHLPQVTVEVLHEPKVRSTNHVDNVGRFSVRIHNFGRLLRQNHNFEDFVRLRIINILEGPPLDFSISACCDEVVIFKKNHFNGTLMERCFLGNVQNEVSLDKLTFPENEGSLLGAAENFAVGQLVVARHVGQLQLTKLSNFALKFQTSEGLGHFPETDMGET